MKLQDYTVIYYYLLFLLFFFFFWNFHLEERRSMRYIDNWLDDTLCAEIWTLRNCTRRKCKVLLAIVKVFILRGQSSKAYVHTALRVSSNLNNRAKGWYGMVIPKKGGWGSISSTSGSSASRKCRNTNGERMYWTQFKSN